MTNQLCLFLLAMLFSLTSQHITNNIPNNNVKYKKNKPEKSFFGRNLQTTLHNVKVQIDSSNITNFSNTTQRDYFLNMIVPYGIEYITSLLQINSTGTLPAFGDTLSECDDDGDMTIPVSYKTTGIDADYLLFVNIKSTVQNNWAAYSKFCTLGSIFKFNNFLKLIFITLKK